MKPQEILETLWSSSDIREQINAVEAAEQHGGLEQLCEECESNPEVRQIARATWVLNAAVNDGEFIGRVMGWSSEQASTWAETLWQEVGMRDKNEIIQEIQELASMVTREYRTIGDALPGASGARELAKWWAETSEILSIQQV